MNKKLFIFTGVVVLAFVVVYLLAPQRPKGCVLRRDKVTLSTVQKGTFEESFPFTANVSGDSTSQTITAPLDEIYFSRVSPGQTASTWFNDKEHFFTITHKDSGANDGRFQVTLSSVDPSFILQKKNESLRMRLIVSEAENTLMLNVGGFYKDTGGKYVYVVLPGEKVAKRNVMLGRKNPEYIEVLSGLTAGDVVITSSYENFNDVDDADLETIHDLVE